MREGELNDGIKKKSYYTVNVIFQDNPNNAESLDELKPNADMVFVEDVRVLLDEAKKEFPILAAEMLSTRTNSQANELLLTLREEWFEKWFGSH
jgi:hypothetical protein